MLETGSLNVMKDRFEFLSSKPSDECGCPEEEWVIDMFNVTIHLEPVTGGDIFIDCGDWQHEASLIFLYYEWRPCCAERVNYTKVEVT